jgi:broad specificity phosphatase PhoE
VGSVLLVRHGQASWGTDDYDVLSETGWEQSRLLGRALADRGTDPAEMLLVRGALRRHRETLEGVAEGAGWELDALDVLVDGDWDEFDHHGVLERHGGDPEAFPDKGAAGADRAAFQAWFERATMAWATAGVDGWDAHAYAETYAAFLARTAAALERTADRAARRTALVVTSGGVVAACASALIDLGEDAAVRARVWNRLNTVVVNSSVTKLVLGRRGTTLVSFNEHVHLEGGPLTYR